MAIGAIARHIAGDAVIHISGTDRRIVFESKADTSFSFGDPAKVGATTAGVKSETTSDGQGLTALVNREAKISIVVHFALSAHSTVTKRGIIQSMPEQPGFIVIADRVNESWSAHDCARAGAWSMLGLGRPRPVGCPWDLSLSALAANSIFCSPSTSNSMKLSQL